MGKVKRLKNCTWVLDAVFIPRVSLKTQTLRKFHNMKVITIRFETSSLQSGRINMAVFIN